VPPVPSIVRSPVAVETVLAKSLALIKTPIEEPTTPVPLVTSPPTPVSVIVPVPVASTVPLMRIPPAPGKEEPVVGSEP